MLDDLELPLVQEIATYDKRMLAGHKPPGMEGSLLQNMGRKPERIILWGVATGTDALKFVEKLDDKFKAGKPVLFTTDITADSKIDNVVIEDLSWQELAGKPERYAYVLKVIEYIKPVEPEVNTEEIDKKVSEEGKDQADQKIDQIIQNTASLRVKVDLIGDDKDYSGVIVLVEGTTDSGDRISFTIEKQVDGIYQREEVPAGEYLVSAIRR